MLERIKLYLKRCLTRRIIWEGSALRRVQVQEEVPSDRFIVIIILMIVFFVGLTMLEIVHLVWLGTWNDNVFNGIMLVVGTIVGAVWGRSQT
ncbi:MAG: hypothetical protein ABIJ47_07285 [Candidatus Bathyarchaeota archaeon]